MSYNCSLLQFLKMTAEKHYEYHLLLLPGMCQVNPIDLGFTFAFFKQDFCFQISLSHISHLLYNSAKPGTPDYFQIFAKPTQLITIRFCQTHPDDYNQIFATSTGTITVRFLPNSTWTITIRFLPHTTQDYNRFLPHSQR